MEIIVEPPPAPGVSGLLLNPEGHGAGPRKDPGLRALISAGMSEQTALELVLRLSAGDIWSG
jgi:hypothetical protein